MIIEECPSCHAPSIINREMKCEECGWQETLKIEVFEEISVKDKINPVP